MHGQTKNLAKFLGLPATYLGLNTTLSGNNVNYFFIRGLYEIK
jgi:hypothetical protein